ncbi:SdrD B-like domain-containing protein, partial [Pseudoalteromonas aurantia]
MKRLFCALWLILVSVQVLAVDLQISTFIDLDTKVPRGAQIRYQVDFENVEQDVANNVQLIFPIPATTSFISSDSAVCKFNAGQSRLECLWPSIDGTDVLDKLKRVQFTIKTSKDTAQTIASEVSVSATNEDASKLQNNAETQNTSIVAGTDLKIVSLRSEPQQVYINETYTYTLHITNNGPDEATNVAVKHVLPSYATWVEKSESNSNGWSCGGAQTLICSLSKLAVGASQSLVIKAKLSQLGSGTVTATSSVSSATAEINSADNQASVSNQVKEHADVAVELKALKSNGTPSYWGPLSLTPNEAHQYQIVAKNNGPNTASSAQFVLTLAAGISDVVVAQASGWSCSVNMAGAQPKITCDRTAVASGGSDTLKVTAKAPSSEATYTNSALISANLSDRNQANNTASAQIKVTKSNVAKMSLIKSITSLKSQYGANDTITFLLTARNASAQTLTVKTLTDALPDSVDFVSYSSTAFNCNYQAAGSQVVCTPNTAQLAANNSISATIVAKVKASVSNATAINRANIVFDSSDSSNESIAASAAFSTIDSQPVLSASKSSSLQWKNKNHMGKRFEFKIKVTNSGGAKATGVKVFDTLINGYTAESATVQTSNNSDVWSCPSQGSINIECTGDISAGAYIEVIIRTRSPFVVARPENTAVVKHSSLTTDLTATYNGWGQSSINPLDKAPLKLILKKIEAVTGVENGLVRVGQNINTEIKVVNETPILTQGILTVDILLEDKESFVSTGSNGGNWHCTASGKRITCEYKKMVTGVWQGIQVNQAQQASLLTITTKAEAKGQLTSHIAGEDKSGFPGQVKGEVSILSTESADLKVTKTANLSQLSAVQNELSYQIEVENVSGETITGDGLSALLIKDTFAGTFKARKGNVETGIRFAENASSQLGATFSCARSDAGQYQDTVSTITCRLGNSQQFKVGDKLILTMHVSRPFVTVNGNLNNLVEVSSSTHVDTDTSNNKSNVSVPVVPKFDVGITLASYATTPILSGDEALLTLEVSNMSATTATGVVLKHTFTPPSGRTFQFISSTFSRSGQASICTFNASNVLSCPIGTLGGNEVQTVTVKLRPKSYHDRKSWILASTSNVTAANIDNDINKGNNTQLNSLQVNVRDANLKIENNDVTDPVAWYPVPRAFPSSLDNVLVYKVDLEYLFDNTGDLSVASGVGYDFTMTPSGADKQLQFLCDGSAKTGCTAAQARCNSINTVISSAHTITCKGPENSGNDLAEFELRENRYGSEDNIYTRYLYFKVLSRPKTTGEVSATTARIFSNENDPITANNSEAEQTSIRVAVDLSLIKRASLSKVAVGSVFNYFLDVGNAGPGDAADNIIYDYLSHDLELAGIPSIAGGRCVTDQAIKSGESIAKTRVRCTVNTIAKGQSLTATIPVKLISVPTGSTLYNDAWIETKGFDVNPSNNRDDLTLPLSKGNISGQVFFDKNNDGVLQTSADSGISGITIELSGTESTGKNIGPLLKNTGTSGEFVFEDLSAGTYQLKQSIQSQLSGYQDGFDSRNNSIISGSNNSDVISNITLTANQSSSGNLFAETLLAGDASVEGAVF